jgi:Na+/H+-dicarboxylate symporter
VPAADVVGTLGINATPMTILPLVVSKLGVSIAGQDDGPAIGRAGRRAAFAFLVLLTAAAALSAAVMPAAFSWLPIDEATAAALRAGVPAVEAGTSPAAAGQWITSLVPSIAFRAAADNAVMPVLVFTAAFALGASRISRELRESIVRFFRAIGAAITVLLHWIVALAPVGVFALGLALAMRLGAGIVTALAYDVVVSSAAMVAITAAPYLVVYAGAGVAPPVPGPRLPSAARGRPRGRARRTGPCAR